MEIWAMCMYMYMWDVCNTLETLHIIICWTSRYTMRNSLVPRPPCPAFVSCSTKNGGRPGRIYHVMHAAADVTFSLLTSEFVLSPSLFFPWIQFVLSFQFVLRVRFLLDWLWLATVRDVSSGMHHVINPSRPSPHFSTASNKSWAWRPGNEANAQHVFSKDALTKKGHTVLVDVETVRVTRRRTHV